MASIFLYKKVVISYKKKEMQSISSITLHSSFLILHYILLHHLLFYDVRFVSDNVVLCFPCNNAAKKYKCNNVRERH